MEQSKKWYQSKLVLLGLTLVGVYGSNLLFGWLGANVTPEQLDAIESTQPQVVEIVERVKSGESVLNVIGTAAGVIIVIVRTWFTDKLLKLGK